MAPNKGLNEDQNNAQNEAQKRRKGDPVSRITPSVGCVTVVTAASAVLATGQRPAESADQLQFGTVA